MATLKQNVLDKVKEYREIQSRYESIASILVTALPLGNQYGIEFQEVIDYETRPLTVLKHKCRMRFAGYSGVHRYIQGMLIFERVTSDGEIRPLFTIYFDDLGNGSDEVHPESFTRDMTDAQSLTNWVAIQLLRAFLYDTIVAGTRHIEENEGPSDIH